MFIKIGNNLGHRNVSTNLEVLKSDYSKITLEISKRKMVERKKKKGGNPSWENQNWRFVPISG